MALELEPIDVVGKRRRMRGQEDNSFGSAYSPDKYSMFDTESRPSRLAAGQSIQQESATPDILSGGAMSSGNPYAMAAGMGLKVLSEKEKARRREHESLQLMKQRRIDRQQRAIGNLINVSQGLKNL
jgi:hypothetical protein